MHEVCTSICCSLVTEDLRIWTTAGCLNAGAPTGCLSGVLGSSMQSRDPSAFPLNPPSSITRLPVDQISACSCLWLCLFLEICLKRICGFSCQRFGTSRLKLEGSLRGSRIKCIALQCYSTTLLLLFYHSQEAQNHINPSLPLQPVSTQYNALQLTVLILTSCLIHLFFWLILVNPGGFFFFCSLRVSLLALPVAYKHTVTTIYACLLWQLHLYCGGASLSFFYPAICPHYSGGQLIKKVLQNGMQNCRYFSELQERGELCQGHV